MTKAYSLPDDNCGRCESCDRPETLHEAQIQVPVLLGGGIGWGTMWMCGACMKRREERERQKSSPDS